MPGLALGKLTLKFQLGEVFVGNESAYAAYKGLVKRQEEAMYLEEQRQEENVQDVK